MEEKIEVIEKRLDKLENNYENTKLKLAQLKLNIMSTIYDIQYNDNGDDYSKINVINILKDILGDEE